MSFKMKSLTVMIFVGIFLIVSGYRRGRGFGKFKNNHFPRHFCKITYDNGTEIEGKPCLANQDCVEPKDIRVFRCNETIGRRRKWSKVCKLYIDGELEKDRPCENNVACLETVNEKQVWHCKCKTDAVNCKDKFHIKHRNKISKVCKRVYKNGTITDGVECENNKVCMNPDDVKIYECQENSKWKKNKICKIEIQGEKINKEFATCSDENCVLKQRQTDSDVELWKCKCKANDEECLKDKFGKKYGKLRHRKHGHKFGHRNERERD